VAESLCDRIAIIQAGVIRACGTMAELRSTAESGAQGLEQIFLRLTGENAARALVDVLDA
jgi:ABC-type multidrug transport system ATPase subunit